MNTELSIDERLAKAGVEVFDMNIGKGRTQLTIQILAYHTPSCKKPWIRLAVMRPETDEGCVKVCKQHFNLDI